MRRVDYDARQHAVYHAGRQHPEATARQWRELLRKYASRPPARRWLDVGSGTGRFSVLLAETFDADVVGVEPSPRMRAEALRNSAHPRVAYREGSGEALGVESAGFDAAMMSMVYHHLRDPAASARELRRALTPGARFLLRNALRDRHLESTFYGYFEAAWRLDSVRLPALSEVRACVTRAGFVERHHETVSQITDTSHAAFLARMRTRPFSTFELMSEAEIEAGFERLEAAVRRDPTPPAIEYVELLVFEAC